MKIAVTGATGFVGHFAVAHLLASGHEVVALGRHPSAHRRAGYAAFDLAGTVPDLAGCEALVHAALSHLPGRYRGGEGAEPEAFVRTNLDGSVRLFEAVRDAGVRRIVFLSSRAVYGAYPPGTRLHEGLEPLPDTLYGRIKHKTELALAGLASERLAVASLRATGVYGPPVPGLRHKWHELLRAFAAGEVVEPRAGTEVHARDVAEAIRLLLTAKPAALAPTVFNLSDFVLDRRDLLLSFARITGVEGRLPELAEENEISQMTVVRLRALGWSPTGPGGLTETLSKLATEVRRNRVQAMPRARLRFDATKGQSYQ